jgi:hypothetical protein
MPAPLTQDVVDLYREWRDACAGVWDAYARWSTARPYDRQAARWAYGAAVDREEQACRLYADVVAGVVYVHASWRSAVPGA